jgi:hypothetical protein
MAPTSESLSEFAARLARCLLWQEITQYSFVKKNQQYAAEHPECDWHLLKDVYPTLTEEEDAGVSEDLRVLVAELYSANPYSPHTELGWYRQLYRHLVRDACRVVAEYMKAEYTDIRHFDEVLRSLFEADLRQFVAEIDKPEYKN